MRGLLIGLAVLAGLASLIRYFPLSWAGTALPSGVGTYSGTIWNGQVSNVPLLGAVSVNGSLGGMQLQTPPGEVTFSGDVTPNGVTDLVLSMPIARLPMSDTRLEGLAGRMSLQIDEAVIKDGACVSATGRASSDVLAANRGRFQWAGPELSGPVDCIDGRLRVQLSGEDAGQAVAATITTGLDGIYRSEISVTTIDAAAGNVLTLFGFNPADAGRYTLSEQGRWR